MSEPRKPYSPLIEVDAKGSEAKPRATPAPAQPRRPTLEPPPKRPAGATMDQDDRPSITPPGAVRRTATAVGATARAVHGSVQQTLANNSGIALAFWFGHCVAYAHLLATLLGWRSGPTEYVYVQRCEDVETRHDQIKQGPR